MFEVKGQYATAKVFSDRQDEVSVKQIAEMLNQPFMEGSQVRIMPDYHAGKGCVIGTTMSIKDKIVPNLVGVDVGCGVLTIEISERSVDFERVDQAVRRFVPSGLDVHENGKYNAHVKGSIFERSNFRAGHVLNNERTAASLGTLGGGNHFIEISEDVEGKMYLTIHTGSRYVGAKIANYYQKQAIAQQGKSDVQEIIQTLKEEGRHQEIQTAIQNFKNENPVIPKELAYLEGQLFHDYLHDMRIAQIYAVRNREAIAMTILDRANLNFVSYFDTIHNYIDTKNMILRKGAVAAPKGKRLIIPINMRDGSIIATGRGNKDWNESAPHGAGRVLSRTKAKSQLSLEDFQETMRGVWTTSVNADTLDEAPMAYKPMQEILDQIGETVDILKVIKPVYNFKASEVYVPKKQRTF